MKKPVVYVGGVVINKKPVSTATAVWMFGSLTREEHLLCRYLSKCDLLYLIATELSFVEVSRAMWQRKHTKSASQNGSNWKFFTGMFFQRRISFDESIISTEDKLFPRKISGYELLIFKFI